MTHDHTEPNMTTILKQYLLILVATLSFVFMPAAANAQYVQLYCNAGGTVGGGQLYYADQPNSLGACEYQGIKHVFSQIICNFVIILNNVLGQTYCGIQSYLAPILAILLTLYIVVFGAQILMGTAQLNAKEILVRLLKIAAVWVFATQSTWGISYIFQFFLGVVTEGSMWVINSIHMSDAANMPVTDANGDFMPMYAYLDNLIYSAVIGPFTNADNKVIAFFLILMFFFPVIFAMAVSWLIMTLTMLARTLIDFLLGLSAIAFLIALSPIFLSFMLFQSTVHFFEDWLKYLTSYSLQLVLIFAIIALWITVMSIFGGFFTQLSNLIFPYQHILVTSTFSPDNTWGICPYIASTSPPGNPGSDCVVGLPCMPSLYCNPFILPLDATIIPPSQLLFRQDFWEFLTYNLAALIIIAYTFSTLMKNAPDIARQLAGPGQVPPLSAGFGASGFGQATSGGSGSGASAPSGSGKAVSDFAANAAQLVRGRGNHAKS